MKKCIAVVFALAFMVTIVVNASASDVLSKDKGYSLITPASQAYPDDGKKLTDGVFGTIPDGGDAYYSGGAYVGFEKGDVDEKGNFSVILDLGEIMDISDFTVGYLNETGVGISAPKSVSFSVSSQRNGEYTSVGTIETVVEAGKDEKKTFAKTLTKETRGQFVLVTITPSEYKEGETTNISKWTFIDEIAVGGTSAENENSDTSAESGVTSDDSLLPNTSDASSMDPDDESSTPQTGDTNFGTVAFSLLAIAAVTMLFALFATSRKEEF